MKAKQLKRGVFFAWSYMNAHVLVSFRDGYYKVAVELSDISPVTGLLWCYLNCASFFTTFKAAKAHAEQCKAEILTGEEENSLVASFLCGDQYDVWGEVIREACNLCDYCFFNDLPYLTAFEYHAGIAADYEEWERLEDYKKASQKERANYQEFLLKRIEAAQKCGMDY